jgi:hypothetical protein
LPEKGQLSSIVDLFRISPLIDSSIFLGELSDYWASTSDPEYAGGALGYNFNYGGQIADDKDLSNKQLCL